MPVIGEVTGTLRARDVREALDYELLPKDIEGARQAETPGQDRPSSVSCRGEGRRLHGRVGATQTPARRARIIRETARAPASRQFFDCSASWWSRVGTRDTIDETPAQMPRAFREFQARYDQPYFEYSRIHLGNDARLDRGRCGLRLGEHARRSHLRRDQLHLLLVCFPPGGGSARRRDWL
ncbi:hypothetical protein ACH40F_53345 [Streptomyces sp. NPDC020794]|uniref:hypothetical protein n=1 Tax=unclassified Streptomyces TaxID=2593676 RepID=UPI0036E1D382